MTKHFVLLALLLIPCAALQAQEPFSLMIGEWSFQVCFEVAGDGLQVTTPHDAPDQATATISFSADGSGKVKIGSDTGDFQWEAQPDFSIRYKYAEYESSLYFREIGADQLLMIEKQRSERLSIAVLTRVQ